MQMFIVDHERMLMPSVRRTRSVRKVRMGCIKILMDVLELDRITGDPDPAGDKGHH